MQKIKDISLIVLSSILIFGLSLFFIVKGSDEYSASERRQLASMPKPSFETLTSGRFMSDFESFTLDQFPLRDTFRSIKAITVNYVLRQKTNNGFYVYDGYISKLDYPANMQKIDISLDKISEIYESLIKDKNCNVYLSLVPDKNYFMAEESGHLSVDYGSLFEHIKGRLPFASYIDITKDLKLSDYYKTDQHWKQECLIPLSETLAKGLNIKISSDYTEKDLSGDFYGTFYGQAALPLKPDHIKYLTNSDLEGCTVTSYSTGKPKKTTVYDMKKAEGKDPYEMFLGGSDPFIIIENPNATSDRELVIFRDSFGSSLTPLLVSGYSKITLIDLRYMQSSMLGAMIKFNGQDVLFMYSTLVLSNTIAA